VHRDGGSSNKTLLSFDATKPERNRPARGTGGGALRARAARHNRQVYKAGTVHHPPYTGIVLPGPVAVNRPARSSVSRNTADSEFRLLREVISPGRRGRHRGETGEREVGKGKRGEKWENCSTASSSRWTHRAAGCYSVTRHRWGAPLLLGLPPLPLEPREMTHSMRGFTHPSGTAAFPLTRVVAG